MDGVKVGIRGPSGISALQVGVTVTLMRSCPVLLRDSGLEANAAVGWVGSRCAVSPVVARPSECAEPEGSLPSSVSPLRARRLFHGMPSFIRERSL
jgi:hypothetical protein